MPTYTYRCSLCEGQFDINQSIHDKPLTKCPECEGELTKVFGKVGVSFKGTGFYKTDSQAKPKTD